MSLFEWSTPERRKVNQVLPIIPNEIYFCIFEHIALPTACLTPEELKIFSNLSGVCRFFANFCLPRIYEIVEFNGSIFCKHIPTEPRNDAIYKASREATLCTQIAAKQPLAVSLAKRVRSCRFINWELDDTAPGAVRLYLTGMLHMKNIRELEFLNSFVGTEHWSVIATLESLEELSFDVCKFLEGPADIEPEGKPKVRVSRLRVADCTGLLQPVAAIHPQYLRTLSMDSNFFGQVDWLPQSGLIQLCFWLSPCLDQDWYSKLVHTLLMQVPPSLEILWLPAYQRTAVDRDMVRSMFADPAWKNLSHLRSLTLEVLSEDPGGPENAISFVLDCISPLTDLQSFTLIECDVPLEISPTGVRRILHDKLSPSSSLTYADIDGGVFRLVDGEWLHSS